MSSSLRRVSASLSASQPPSSANSLSSSAALHAVLFGELGVRVERVLFVHHFDEALVAQHDRAQHRLEVVLVLILREDGHALVLAERHFALVGLDLAREDLQKGGLAPRRWRR